MIRVSDIQRMFNVKIRPVCHDKDSTLVGTRRLMNLIISAANKQKNGHQLISYPAILNPSVVFETLPQETLGSSGSFEH